MDFECVIDCIRSSQSGFYSGRGGERRDQHLFPCRGCACVARAKYSHYLPNHPRRCTEEVRLEFHRGSHSSRCAALNQWSRTDIARSLGRACEEALGPASSGSVHGARDLRPFASSNDKPEQRTELCDSDWICRAGSLDHGRRWLRRFQVRTREQVSQETTQCSVTTSRRAGCTPRRQERRILQCTRRGRLRSPARSLLAASVACYERPEAPIANLCLFHRAGTQE